VQICAIELTHERFFRQPRHADQEAVPRVKIAARSLVEDLALADDYLPKRCEHRDAVSGERFEGIR